MEKTLDLQFETGLRLLAEKTGMSDLNARKPLLPHVVRVGSFLYKKGYADTIVLGGLLHDALEWTDITAGELKEQFGADVLRIVKACTKDDSITDPQEKTNELITRCVVAGEEALIVKTADILDSYYYYAKVNNQDQLAYCNRNAKAILSMKTVDMEDVIFMELEQTYKTHAAYSA
ncbi:MAG: hypothetical protein COU32_01730 [Candidatus Magasanikbacteria bacterium CG10_big_fil_rev_8_21_14_0_10_42_10]|uniref:HD/PDEase domain-containing protein n=2 Tax=Candidatus Magasanikiibacteriota TaxID=1752731 RepID=A0A2H0TWG4_9BACT|nr:MAG: hypothetical protein COU32_01730 [Candidatus Magasanikbacteria bacterium CG10_big_fil_rev_8_21_14_0_10_42_10]PIZ93767.1 MAG: hypothetical protein COX82_02140 [Candidatus Magasanikbacteria bacterium CG_4_10_14_0_2_um_filter_41_10]